MKFRLVMMTALSAAWVFSAQAQQQQPNLQDVMKAMGAMMGGGASVSNVVDFRELKALLPAELPSLKRTKAGGEKNSAMGMTVSVAEATYANEDAARSFTVKISDMGGSAGIMGFMQYGWASMEVDREDETGYERTTNIGAHKAMEKFNTANQSGSLQVLVKNRFLVECESEGLSPEELKAAVAKIDFDKLASLQPDANKDAPQPPAE